MEYHYKVKEMDWMEWKKRKQKQERKNSLILTIQDDHKGKEERKIRVGNNSYISLLV
jgi:hypothetical protein